MATDTLPADIINSTKSQIISSFANSIPESVRNKFYLLLDIGKILLIVLIIYFIFLIILKIIKLRDSHNLKVIAQQTTDINQKLSILLEKSVKKEKQKKH